MSENKNAKTPADDGQPVAWIDQRIHGWPDCFVMQPDPPHTVPLYTVPQKREWVGLTDEEIDECERLATFRYQRHKYSVHGQIITPADGLEWHFAQAIEQALKEKNKG